MRWRGRRPRSPLGWVALVVAAVFVGIPIVALAVATMLALIGAAVGVLMSFGWPFVLGFAIYRVVSRQPRVVYPYPLVPAPAGFAPGWAPATAPPPAAAPPPDPLARLPEDLRARVDRIRAKAWSLLQQRTRFPAGSRNLHVVQRTLDQYLPATLDSYLSLPPGSDDRVAAPDGRTAIQVVRDQLDVLEAKLDEVAGDLWQADVQRLLANERFLEAHFGRREPDELKIP
jgi:hypothetical protein